MNSRVITEYEAGVSRRSVARRPPASELDAAKPVSLSVFTVNGDNCTASPGPVTAGTSASLAAGATWPVKAAAASQQPPTAQSGARNLRRTERVGLKFTGGEVGSADY